MIFVFGICVICRLSQYCQLGQVYELFYFIYGVDAVVTLVQVLIICKLFLVVLGIVLEIGLIM
jgi:hypothetical protein